MIRRAAGILLLAASAWTAPESPPLARIERGELRVTEGALLPGPDGRMRIEAPKVRAVAPRTAPSVAELRFTYLGPSAAQEPLQSGEMRRQIGLKLRAADGCNVLYAMWRIAPKPGMIVSLKRNPDQHESRECGNRGYQNLRPARAGRVPQLAPGSTHVLRAEQSGDRLQVLVDGALAWDGSLPEDALSLNGPVGFRSDNGRFELELLAAPR